MDDLEYDPRSGCTNEESSSKEAQKRPKDVRSTVTRTKELVASVQH